MLEFFLIRQSVAVCVHSPSVECVDHYLTVPGSVISLNGDEAILNSISWPSLNALPNWDGSVFNGRHRLVDGSSDIMRRERERERGEHAALIRMRWPKVTVKAHICISFDFCGPFFFFFFVFFFFLMGVAVIASLMEVHSPASWLSSRNPQLI